MQGRSAPHPTIPGIDCGGLSAKGTPSVTSSHSTTAIAYMSHLLPSTGVTCATQNGKRCSAALAHAPSSPVCATRNATRNARLHVHGRLQSLCACARRKGVPSRSHEPFVNVPSAVDLGSHVAQRASLVNRLQEGTMLVSGEA